MNVPVKDRVKKHYLSQNEKGLVEVRIWVPKGREDKIRAAAKKLRDEIVVA